MVTWKVTDNILPDVVAEIRRGMGRVLSGAGDVYKETAIAECPVSGVNTPGYVHLWQTIDYDVDQESTFYQQFVTFYVTKSYAQFVNDGTSRMAPRPFHTDGVLAVGDKIDDVVTSVFRDMMLGRAGGVR